MERYNISYYMHIGQRANQEDCIFINGDVFQEDIFDTVGIYKASSGLYAICDGMGGMNKGEWASRFICDHLKKDLKFSNQAIIRHLKSIQRLIEKQGVQRSGSTIAAVLLNNNNIKIFNCGDSRVYRITQEQIEYVSHDHSFVQRGVDEGYISTEEAFDHINKNVIEFGIGDIFKKMWDESIKTVFINSFKIEEAHSFLICSDGVSDVLRDNEIFAILAPQPLKAIPKFIDIIKERMTDNFSFILISQGGLIA